MVKVGIACGGTGGHLYPGIAVAEILVDAGHEVRLYISSKDIDRAILSAYPQFKSVVLPTTGWPGFTPRLIPFGLNLFKAMKLSRLEMRHERPAVVLGMGGFTSAPLILSAARSGIPTVLHESNAIPGKVTRWLAGKADKILLGFGACAEWLDSIRTVTTGTPLRSSLRRVERATALEYWGLDSSKFTIAVTGGSQGASGLNRMVIQAIPYWADLAGRIQFIHLGGPQDCELLSANYMRGNIKAVVQPFCREMENLYSAADLLISRSGAASLTEAASFDLPSILVPYPNAAEDHQTSNAKIFVDAGAACMIAEGREAEKRLAEEVRRLIADQRHRESMGTAASLLNPRNAAERVAQEVLNAI